MSKVKKEQIKKSNKLFIILTLVFTAIILSGYFGYWLATKDFVEGGIIFQEGNVTYQKYLDNYYEVDYDKTNEGIEININNPCIEIITSRGESMKPFFEEESLDILDTCFPKDKLKIGDIIKYSAEWNIGFSPVHRIVDIDYNKRWVQTQGDNPKTNPVPDDFVSFDRIHGKVIGFLNVLEDKKVVKEEIIEFNESDFFGGNFSLGSINLTTTYFDSLPFLQIDLESCWEVICPCAKDTTTPCMAMCYECEDGI